MELAIGTFWLEGNAFVIYGTEFGILPDQRVCLKATRIGDDWVRPASHTVQSPQRRDGG